MASPSPQPLPKLQLASSTMLHQNLDRMLFHRHQKQIAANLAVTAGAIAGVSSSVNAVNATLDVRLIGSLLTPVDGVDSGCAQDAMKLIRALNALEDRIADSSFTPLPENDANYWFSNAKAHRDLKKHYENGRAILSKHLFLEQYSEEFGALGDKVDDSFDERATRLVEIQNFRHKILTLLLSPDCQSTVIETQPLTAEE